MDPTRMEIRGAFSLLKNKTAGAWLVEGYNSKDKDEDFPGYSIEGCFRGSGC